MADVAVADNKIKSNINCKLIKKRVRNPEEWHKQKQKRLRVAGKEYINANGKIIPSKAPGSDCNCRRQCFVKVPEEVRIKTFEGFYSMKSHDEQNAYLFGLMRQIDIKRKRIKTSSRRTCTFEYFIRVRGRETQVCQTAFKNIHAITERKVRVLCKKMDDGVMFPSDNRGKNSHRKSGEVRLPPGTVDQIKNHIFSIVHTHRLKDFIRLDKVAGLEINISKMWKDYIRTYDPDNIFVTMTKGKKQNSQTEQALPQEQVVTPQSISYGYPGSGHLMNIAENFFAQNQYQPNNGLNGINIPPTNYYPTQPAPLLLQSNTTRPTQTAYIVIQPNHEAPPEPNSVNYQMNLEFKSVKCEKKEKRFGPLVKQWRYSNIFRAEINGPALSAIKTRLAMYHADSETRKKTKHRAPDNVIQNQQPQQALPHNQTLTIYTQ